MKIGVTYPQLDLGSDVAGARAFAEAAQSLGFDYLLAYDHVLGADTTNRPNFTGPYTKDSSFHEPFVLFGYLAAVAPKLELVTSVIILPQRQTALVAKQAAMVDLLTGGKLRFGAGIGWNEVEFEALGEEFRNRGRRFEEQIDVLTRLWTDPVITYAGEFHRITEAGLNPMPVQRPIPIWIGGSSDAAIARAGRLGAGWMPIGSCNAEFQRRRGVFESAARAAGRDPAALGLDARIDMSRVPEAEWPEEIARWRAAGATHLCVNSMYQGYDAKGHIAAIERFRRAAG